MEKAITACPPIRPSTLLTVSQSVSSASDESNAGRIAAPRLNALTGLRFLAAAAVVVSHTQGQFDLPPGLGLWVNLGGAGVTFFFVLCGFILTYVYPRLETAGDRGRFLLARVAR
jgi:peptidoglycan/LPS O-acetylase OafA/YrhL